MNTPASGPRPKEKYRVKDQLGRHVMWVTPEEGISLIRQGLATVYGTKRKVHGLILTAAWNPGRIAADSYCFGTRIRTHSETNSAEPARSAIVWQHDTPKVLGRCRCLDPHCEECSSHRDLFFGVFNSVFRHSSPIQAV